MPTGQPRTALTAVADRRFLIGGWPWRATGYLITSVPVACAVAAPLSVALLPWAIVLHRMIYGGRTGLPLAAALFGTVVILALAPVLGGAVAAVERRRLRLVDARPARSGFRRPRDVGLWPLVRARYADPATWRGLGYAVLLVTVLPVLYLAAGAVTFLVLLMIASPALVDGGPLALGLSTVHTTGEAAPYAIAGLLLLPGLPYVLALTAGAHGALARPLVSAPGGDEALRAELTEVSRSRARLVDAFEAERRRIERDLHDGAQQRLVGLTLQLGLARLDLPAGSDAERAVADAHGQAKALMAELRELIHGIHPRTLVELGLPAALRELADRSPVPVTVHAEPGGPGERPPAQVEATAYFVVAEALTNIAKHSGASAATVTVRRSGDLLLVDIGDDGHGGADPGRGSGLTGLADRAAVVGGRMLLSSPAGGPTLLHVELPCAQHATRSG